MPLEEEDASLKNTWWDRLRALRQIGKKPELEQPVSNTFSQNHATKKQRTKLTCGTYTQSSTRWGARVAAVSLFSSTDTPSCVSEAALTCSAVYTAHGHGQAKACVDVRCGKHQENMIVDHL